MALLGRREASWVADIRELQPNSVFVSCKYLGVFLSTDNRKLCATVSYMPKLKEAVNKVSSRAKTAYNRRTFANLFMVSFILLTSIGAGLIAMPVGLIVAGIGCGIFGFLLGLE
jgi:hypothetical protein